MTLSISLKDKVISSLLAVTHFDLRWIYATRDAFDIDSHASLFSMSFTIATNGGSLFFSFPLVTWPPLPAFPTIQNVRKGNREWGSRRVGLHSYPFRVNVCEL